MKPLALLAAALLSAAHAFASAPAAEFGYSGPAQLRASAAAVPSVAGGPADVIDKSHLLAQCGKDALFGYAETPAQFEEAVALWNGILTHAGIRMGKPTFDKGFYTLPYEAADGLVLRDFTAEPRQFKPKDDASLRENRALISAALAQRGIPIVASYVVTIPEILPTYRLYYLAKEAKRPEDELQLRVLKPGDDIDFDLLAAKGIDILQKPESWMMVYLGRELGWVQRVAKTPEEAQKKLTDRVALLTGMGKVMIDARVSPLTPPFDDYRFLVSIYFYQ